MPNSEAALAHITHELAHVKMLELKNWLQKINISAANSLEEALEDLRLPCTALAFTMSSAKALGPQTASKTSTASSENTPRKSSTGKTRNNGIGGSQQP